MSSIFTRIIQGDLPSYTIYEDERTIAFLDINPRQIGQTLVVSKKEVDHFFDLPDEDYLSLFSTVKRIAKALKKATGATRIWVSIEGFEIAHTHIKLIPVMGEDDLNMHNIVSLKEQDFMKIQNAITSSLS